MTDTTLRFGISMPFEIEDTVDQARWLEELGFEYLGVGEHFVRGNPPGPAAAALPVLGVAAGATERIRLLSSVVLVPFYHPTVLAKLTATLDIASRGRLTLGIGIGGEFPVEFEAAGLDVTQRGRRTNESLDIMRRLWAGDSVSFDGRHFQLTDVVLNPVPTQRPNPPVWVAGRREAAMRRAVRYGDGWYPYFYSPERYQSSVTKITEIASDQGRDLSEFDWAYYSYITLASTAEQAAETAAKALGGNYLYSGDFLNIVRSYCVLGTVDDCVQRLMEYVDSGARQIIFSVTCPREDRKTQIETIVNEVIPGLVETSGRA